MADETVVIAVDGEVDGFDKAMSAVKRQAKDAAKAVDRSFGDIKRGASAVFGGVVGDVEDVGAALMALGPVAGGAATALLTTAASVGAVGLAAYETTSFLHGAAEATGRLKDEDAALQLALDGVYQTIGNKVAPAFEGLTIGVIAGALALNDFVRGVFDGIGKLREWYKNLGPFAKGMVDSATNAFLVLDNIEQLSSGLSDGSIELGGYTDKARGLVASLAIVERTTATTTSAINAATEATEQWSEAIVAGPMLQLPANAALAAEAAEDLQAAISAVHAQQLDEIRQIQAAEDETARARVAAWQSYATSAIDLAGQIAAAVANGAEEGSDAQKRAAMVAFRIQQASALVGVAIDTAAAVTQAIAMFGPPPSPVGIAAMATAGVIGIAQAAIIAAQKPPQIAHTGAVVGEPGPLAPSTANAPDEVTVRARRGEEVQPQGRQTDEAPAVYLRFDHHIADITDRQRAKQRTNPYRQMVMAGRIVGHR